VKVGDLVRLPKALLKDARSGIIVDIESAGDYAGVDRFLVKWLDMSGSQWYLKEYLEVLGESR
jgi:hypothetical protein